jgi:3-hydroxymyristoyl/3-hydroxydecanoyl-(acyl carrier protein) dehydratase
MGSSDVASVENRASTSVVADDDDVFGCHFLHDGIVIGVIIVRLGLLRGKP